MANRQVPEFSSNNCAQSPEKTFMCPKFRTNPVLKHTSVPTKPIFFSDLLEEGQILFGNIVNFALENPTNLWKYDIMCTLILDWYETEI